MADIFFGKFSELISLKPVSENVEIKSEVEISREKKPLNKILIFSSFFFNRYFFVIPIHKN